MPQARSFALRHPHRPSIPKKAVRINHALDLVLFQASPYLPPPPRRPSDSTKWLPHRSVVFHFTRQLEGVLTTPINPGQHYAWAGGHFILLFSAVKYILAAALFRGPSKFWYQCMFSLLLGILKH